MSTSSSAGTFQNARHPLSVIRSPNPALNKRGGEYGGPKLLKGSQRSPTPRPLPQGRGILHRGFADRPRNFRDPARNLEEGYAVICHSRPQTSHQRNGTEWHLLLHHELGHRPCRRAAHEELRMGRARLRTTRTRLCTTRTRHVANLQMNLGDRGRISPPPVRSSPAPPRASSRVTGGKIALSACPRNPG